MHPNLVNFCARFRWHWKWASEDARVFHLNRQSPPVTNPSVDVGIWSLSLVTARPKLPKKSKKAKTFLGNVEISGVSREILVGVEMSNLKKTVTRHTHYRFKGIPQYYQAVFRTMMIICLFRCDWCLWQPTTGVWLVSTMSKPISGLTNATTRQNATTRTTQILKLKSSISWCPFCHKLFPL
jgi:hypothetical protein